ncbi:MAG: hypothetical protein AB1665_05710 [Candidatus Thermoplasmatota archaeon]
MGAAAGEPKVSHTPPAYAERWKEIPLEVQVDPNGTTVSKVLIYYIPVGESIYRDVEMTNTGGAIWRGAIPAQSSSGTVEYYILVYYDDSSLQVIDESEPPTPYRIYVSEGLPFNIGSGWVIGLALIVLMSAFIGIEYIRRLPRKRREPEEEEEVTEPQQPSE